MRRVREESGKARDFITLCACLEVIHTFPFLTNLCPKGMTLGMNEALAVSSSTARSSKSCFRAPALPALLARSLSPSLLRSLSLTPHPEITERRGPWETPPHWHLCPPRRTYFRARAAVSVTAAFSGASNLMNESEGRAAGPGVTVFISSFTADCWCYAHFSLRRCLFSPSPSVFYWGVIKT